LPGDGDIGPQIWTCEFLQADIMGCRAYYGVDEAPDATAAIIDVLLYRPSDPTPAWISIYNDIQAIMPTIPVGEMVSDREPPIIVHLDEGDMLTFEIEESGIGATPDVTNLAVNILMLVQYGSTTTSYTFAT
jgi:hypothetical protein